MLTTTLMVVQGNTKKIETTNQTEKIEFVNVAKAEQSQQDLEPVKYN